MNPLESDNKLVTYHFWFACPPEWGLPVPLNEGAPPGATSLSVP